MARILFASELGSHLGHVGQLLPLASELRARGHEVIFALRDITAAHALLQPRGFRYVQAPLWHPRQPRDRAPPCSYSEILSHYGYRDRHGLLSLLTAWRELYALAAPQMVLAEYAPTALLAARGLPVRRIQYGVGFSVPPHTSPFPNFRTWEEVSLERLKASDAAVLSNINRALGEFGQAPLATLADMLDAEDEFLCTLRELDHYPERGGGEYWGPIYTLDEGDAAPWPEGGGKRIFVYLRPGAPLFECIARQLTESGHSVLWAAPGVAREVVQRFESPRFKFVQKAVRLSDVVTVAEAALLHGGHGTVAAMLLAGVPLALFPTHAEQALMASAVGRTGAGAAAAQTLELSEVGPLLQSILERPQFRQAAAAFASTYEGYDPREVVRRMADRIGS